jgi:hypothetical protein
MVYGSDEGYLSEEVAFTTAKTAGANVPVRLAAFGDMALSVAGALKTVQQVVDKYNESPVSSSASAGIDAVLHFGDLGYALGSTGNVTEYPLNRTQHRDGSHRNVSLTWNRTQSYGMCGTHTSALRVKPFPTSCLWGTTRQTMWRRVRKSQAGLLGKGMFITLSFSFF